MGIDFKYLTFLNTKGSVTKNVQVYYKNVPMAETFQYTGLGNDALQRLDIDKAEVVVKVVVEMTENMAIVDLKFCIPCDHDLTPPSHSMSSANVCFPYISSATL